MTRLTIPIRDRRSGRRILTVKSVGSVAIGLTLLFAVLTVRSEMRNGKRGGEGYGRLFGTQVSGQKDVAKPKYDVITEAPVADQTAADPTLLGPVARAQALGVGIDQPQGQIFSAPTATTTAQDAPAFQPVQPVLRGSGGVKIVGGANGVEIVKPGEQPQRPTLQGGIFKPQQ